MIPNGMGSPRGRTVSRPPRQSPHSTADQRQCHSFPAVSFLLRDHRRFRTKPLFRDLSAPVLQSPDHPSTAPSPPFLVPFVPFRGPHQPPADDGHKMHKTHKKRGPCDLRQKAQNPQNVPPLASSKPLTNEGERPGVSPPVLEEPLTNDQQNPSPLGTQFAPGRKFREGLEFSEEPLASAETGVKLQADLLPCSVNPFHPRSFLSGCVSYPACRATARRTKGSCCRRGLRNLSKNRRR